MKAEVRCPKCGRLLAMRYENGLIESKTGRLVVVTERALLSCLKCGSEVIAGAENERERNGVDSTGKVL